MTEIVYDMEAACREEAIYRTPAAVDRRRRIRQALSPTSGETVLSLGPGPGFEPLELASLTDVESVIGVDQSRAMLELARNRCASTENVSLIEGEATALPSPVNLSTPQSPSKCMGMLRRSLTHLTSWYG